MSLALPVPPERLLDATIRVTREASLPVMKLFRQAQRVWDKDAEGEPVGGGERAKNPVTEADLAADTILREELPALLPGSGWLSEETADNPDRLSCPWVWVVDPIDGTREYVDGVAEFALSVALVADDQPVLAVLYNPAKEDLFTALCGQGAWRMGQRLRASEREDIQGARVLASRNEIRRGQFDAFRDRVEVVPMGSTAYKLALLAAGEGDAYFTTKPRNEWDIAAGVLLCREAGARITDRAGQRHLFNQRETLCHGVVAASSGLHGEVLRLLAS